jgi:hypothetical protein
VTFRKWKHRHQSVRAEELLQELARLRREFDPEIQFGEELFAAQKAYPYDSAEIHRQVAETVLVSRGLTPPHWKAKILCSVCGEVDAESETSPCAWCFDRAESARNRQAYERHFPPPKRLREATA